MVTKSVHKKNITGGLRGCWDLEVGGIRVVKVSLSNSKISMIAVEQCVSLGFS